MSTYHYKDIHLKKFLKLIYKNIKRTIEENPNYKINVDIKMNLNLDSDAEVTITVDERKLVLDV